MSDDTERSAAMLGSHGDTGIMSWEQADQIMQEQRAEIERLKKAIRRLAEQDATLSVREGNVTVTMDGTLTDAERQTIEYYAEFSAAKPPNSKAILLGLLMRLG